MGDMRPKIQYQQLPLAFMTEGRGETPDAGHEGTESPTAKRGPENPAIDESLMEEVCERENLEEAWHRVRSNKGSPGVDGRTIDETRDYLREHWPTIREQLLNGTYRPQPVRRVEIAVMLQPATVAEAGSGGSCPVFREVRTASRTADTGL